MAGILRVGVLALFEHYTHTYTHRHKHTLTHNLTKNRVSLTDLTHIEFHDYVLFTMEVFTYKDSGPLA